MTEVAPVDVDRPDRRTGIFILTGFLGSGKTTFINDLLATPRMADSAVIVNEFGEIGLDGHFLQLAGKGIIELANGCLCCSMRSELVETIAGMPLERLARILIETTGLADPAPLIEAVIADADLNRRCRIEGIVTLVDAVNIERQLSHSQEARLQVALADLIVISKTDLLPTARRDEMLAQLRLELSAINPFAPTVLRDRDSPDSIELLEIARLRALSVGDSRHSKVMRKRLHHHLDQISTTVLQSPTPMSRRSLDAFCSALASRHGDELLRMKGLVAVEGYERPLAIHGVHHITHEPVAIDAWPDGDRSTRIVVILRNGDLLSVETMFAAYAGILASDTPDELAMTDNPLAIPGSFLR